MNDHVHEWNHIDDDSTDYWYCECGEVIPTDNIASRLNATEWFSAKEARRLIRLNAIQEYEDLWLLKEYADILEGKEE